ncbi:glycerate kinase [Acetonema longum]|uniref:Glycerate kinase n=1 Tax=Acetonema longum DSM 6540 TaxID=1009370 RepID=F7NJN0_9FIRM|nr:glycerate kinase [Acetonema longum]EGO63751.1 glycerate kinase [Acetonema longum DSM 6540]
MLFVVAPDSFKGSLPATAVANAMERGVLSVFPDARVRKVPIADGGEGTVESLVAATGGRMMAETVTGPLGTPVEAFWGILGDGETAVIEMAAASGLTLVPAEQRDPRRTTTYGTGQLISAALRQGLRRLIIGIGGSATNDGGAGMAQALGVRFLDAAGRGLPYGGAALAELSSIDMTNIHPLLAEASILVACDVDNPLCGERGASAVYGPQKGATPATIQELDAALERFAAIAGQATGRNIAGLPGAGAAGGLGAGLMYFTDAQLRPGVDIVLSATDFAGLVQEANLVITGEGSTDFQTAYGKAPVGVAKIAGQHQIPVVCLSGGLGRDYESVLEQGIAAAASIVPGPMSLSECMETAAELIQAATARVCRLLLVGHAMSFEKKLLTEER